MREPTINASVQGQSSAHQARTFWIAGACLSPLAFVVNVTVTHTFGNNWLLFAMFVSYALGLGPILSYLILTLFYLLPPAVFWSTGRGLRSGHYRIPSASIVLFILGVLAAVFYFASTRESAVLHQGVDVANGFVIANLAVVLALTLLAIGGRQEAQYWTGFWFHWGLVLWLATIALPGFDIFSN